MPSVDDLLREAFGGTDDEWVRRAPAALVEVRTSHRRGVLVRRSVAVAACAACAVTAVVVVGGGSSQRSVEPVVPPPTAPTSTSGPAPVTTTPLEGTWTSRSLDADDVRAAARRAGAASAASAMLEDLPNGSFRVVMVVRGASLNTLVRSRGTDDLLLDQESISITGGQLRLRPFDVPAATLHEWAVESGVLTMTFVSTTERSTAGVPGEAWHRLLYDSAPLTRQDPQ